MNVRDKEINIFDGDGALYIDGKTRAQLFEAMDHDWVIKGALMSDAHLGYGLPIGGVVATEGMIVPSWVGFDIGCGMISIKLPLKRKYVDRHKDKILAAIYEAIPTGPGGYNSGQRKSVWKKYDDIPKSPAAEVIFNEKRGFDQLATLGGGNHFIEVGYEEPEGEVWVTLHSGSRGVGYKTAEHYMKIAGGGKAREGTWPLRVDTNDGKDYIMDLNFYLEFALENRKQMLHRTICAIANVLADSPAMIQFAQDFLGTHSKDMINRNHNHAELKDGLWIHRKGATHAEDGMLGVIPGNMKDGVFIVKGKGNPKSLSSSSHGAGRVYGRNEAKRKLSVDKFKNDMVGIAAKVGNSTLDESKDAYKNIFDVMKAQDDLVEILHYVKPIINVKA